jgi:hypothetical protein
VAGGFGPNEVGAICPAMMLLNLSKLAHYRHTPSGINGPFRLAISPYITDFWEFILVSAEGIEPST